VSMRVTLHFLVQTERGYNNPDIIEYLVPGIFWERERVRSRQNEIVREKKSKRESH
jgi:hypothetical protein